MGAVFALASAATDVAGARPEAVATGLRTTFAVAAILIAFGLAIAIRRRALWGHPLSAGLEAET